MNAKIKIKLVIVIILFVGSGKILANVQINQAEPILLGTDLFIESKHNDLKGFRLGILTNYTGRDSKSVSTIQNILNSALNLTTVFTPEHGYWSTIAAGKHVGDDSIEGIVTYSLYGKFRKPTRGMLNNVDILIIDIQDIGIRSYTYISTMYNMMQACAENGIKVIVLDRPNPLGGIIVDGAVLDRTQSSFVGIIPVPYIHGCTIGELAMMINGEGWLSNNASEFLKCDLEVICMKNWQRWMQWEDTALDWYPTSPNIPTVNAIRGAAVLGIYGELGIINIGIGTTLPFQYFGLTGMDTRKVKSLFDEYDHTGIVCIETKFSQSTGKNIDNNVDALLLLFQHDNLFQPYQCGIKLMFALKSVHKEILKSNRIQSNSIEMFRKVTGSSIFLNMLIESNDLQALLEEAQSGIADFLELRKKYQLYN